MGFLESGHSDRTHEFTSCAFFKDEGRIFLF